MKRAIQTLFATLLCVASATASAGAECVVPSKPGGAMDLTCKLAQKALPDSRLKLAYLPGGIGAVAWHTLVSQRRAEPDTLVAFSGGSLLNLAEGKFGKANAADVRWVAALGVDYGMIAVRADSPWRTLRGLLDAIRRDPQQVLVGVSGTIGSQDWMKVALLARRAGIEPRRLRFVALEGGGETFTAMHANYVQVISGDASEAALYADPGKPARRAGRSAHGARAGLRRRLARDPRPVDGAGRIRCRLPPLGRRLRPRATDTRFRAIAYHCRPVPVLAHGRRADAVGKAGHQRLQQAGQGIQPGSRALTTP
jgi:hypothetical protein